MTTRAVRSGYGTPRPGRTTFCAARCGSDGCGGERGSAAAGGDNSADDVLRIAATCLEDLRDHSGFSPLRISRADCISPGVMFRPMGFRCLDSAEFAVQLPLLVADAVWEVKQDGNTRTVDELTEALVAWRGDSAVSRAAALLFPVATFDGFEMQPLRRELVRAAQATWQADPDSRQRVRILGYWANRECEEEAENVVVELRAASVAVCAEAATDSDEDLVWHVRALEDLVAALDRVEVPTAGQIAHGVLTSGRMVAVLVELTARDRPAYRGRLAAAHATAARFLADADEAESALAESERGVHLSQENLQHSPVVDSVLALDKVWATHHRLLERFGDSTRAEASFGNHRAVLHAGMAEIAESGTAQDLRRVLVVVRRRQCWDDAVTVSGRIVELATEAAVADDAPAWQLLATALREHGEFRYRAGRCAAARSTWRRFIEVRRRLGELDAVEYSVVAAFQQLVQLAARLDNPQLAVEFERFAIAERVQEPDAELAVLVDELRDHAWRLHAVGFDREAAEAAERGLAYARILAEQDPAEHRATLCRLLNSAAALARDAHRLSAADLRSAEAVALTGQLAQADPGQRCAAADALYNRALAVGGLRNRTAAKELLSRSVEMYRTIAADGIDVQAELANVLCSAGANHIDLSEYEAAFTCIQQARTTFAHLADIDPGRYLGKHAHALTFEAVAHHRVGAYSLAHDAGAAALELCARLEPGHQRDGRRSHALRTLSDIAADSGNDRAALEYATSLVELVARMVDEGRTAQAELIAALSTLTRRQSQLGAARAALETSTRAVALLHELPETERELYRCADILDRHACALTGIGDHDAALDTSALALTYAEQVLADDRGAHLVTVATILNNHGLRLANARRPAEAVVCTARAIDLNEELALLDEQHRPEVGISLLNWANQLIDLERPEEALEAALRAVAVFDEPDPCGTPAAFAYALSNQAAALSGLDRHREAVEVEERALRIVEHAAEHERLAYLPQLAGITRSLAAWLFADEQWPTAGQRSIDAMRLWWEAAGHDRRHLPDLADTVGRHGDYCRARRESAAAVTDMSEIIDWARCSDSATDVRERLAVVDLLDEYACTLADSGQRQAALVAAQDILALVEAAVEDSEDDLRARLADALDWLADALADCGRFHQALPHAARALGVWRQLADEDRAHRGRLAWSLWHHAAWQAEVRSDATASLRDSEEALRLYADLAEADPAEEEYLAGALVDHARHLARLERHTEALEISNRAVESFESLATSDPDRYGADLAACLRHHANHLAATGSIDDAIDIARAASEFIESAVAAVPLRYLPEQAEILETTARLLIGRDRSAAAMSNERAQQIFARLVSAEPELFAPRLHDDHVVTR
ncbi:hypothetical protein ACFVMC_11260 [Nocardia sp. NPDC127579]|uniref:hypothetical protein n=1 Tax=Nocardia sp. NPDC127579 TaxID=3345402 RepID=UPI0036278506